MSDPSPYWLATKVYASEPCARTFSKDLDSHLLHGYVFNTPKLFAMGRPVSRYYPGVHIADPRFVDFHEVDAWFVYCMAGDLQELFKFVPFPLPFIGWERNNKIRFYSFDKVQEKICAQIAR